MKDDRHRFLRKSLQDAQAEIGHLESPLKVVESVLLTAMGALGADCGFSGLRQPEANGIKMVGRGLENATLAGIEDAFQNLVDRHFPGLETTPYPSQSDILILPPIAPDPSDLMNTGRIRVLAGWRMGTKMTGLMGLGANLNGTPYLDSEIDFLYRLLDHTMAAIHAIEAHSVIRTLKNELDLARQRAVESAVRNESAKKELEQTLFRLSGFNDIFHELSGLRESVKVLDAFLLVMLGIFSAQSGTILYGDDATRNAHTAMRGVDARTAHDYRPAEVREKLEDVFESLPGVRLEDMQAAVVPLEQWKELDLFSFRSDIGVLFKVDQAARGVICLGRRLVETQYGAKEEELLLAFTHTFLAFLKNSKSFETIERLHADQQQKNRELEKTVQALSESRRTIAGLEKAGERIKAAMVGAMVRSTRASVLDVALILLAGTILGLVYNFAGPSGIPVVPPVWRYPPSPQIDVEATQAQLDARALILVDARPAEFYKQQHIRGALNLPLALFDFVYMMRFSRIDPQTPIVVYGRNISRHYDEEIAYKLRQRGHPNVSVLTGGLDAWRARELRISP